MDILRWIGASLLLLVSLYLVVVSWVCFIRCNVLHRGRSSSVPFLGGVFGAVGFVLLPLEGMWRFFWVPLVLDLGSIPLLVLWGVHIAGKKHT